MIATGFWSIHLSVESELPSTPGVLSGESSPVPDRWSPSVFPGAAQGDKESDFQQVHSDAQRMRVRFKMEAVKARCRKVRAGLVHGHSLWGMEERIKPPKSYSIARGLDSIVRGRALGRWLSHQGGKWFWCRATVGLQLPTYGANIQRS